MHEHWISRAQAQGNPELMEAILESEYNVSLLCNDCNLNRAESEEGRKLLRRKSLERYGGLAILDWMNKLPFKTEAVQRQFVQEVNSAIDDAENSKL